MFVCCDTQNAPPPPPPSKKRYGHFGKIFFNSNFRHFYFYFNFFLTNQWKINTYLPIWKIMSRVTANIWEHSGSVVECLTRDQGAVGLSLNCISALRPWARHINPSLVLVQPRITCSYITERLLMGLKE